MEEKIQTPTIKVDSEFVDRATQIVELFTAHLDAKCPHCLELLKSGLRPTTPEPEQTTTTIPVPPRNDNHVSKS